MTNPSAEQGESSPGGANSIRSRATENDDGERVLERLSTRGGSDTTHDVNITKLLGRPGPRTTGNSFILQVEHEAIERGDSVGNPAHPSDESAIPHVVTQSIDALETVDEVRMFIENEIEHGPRRYVVGLANERKLELRGEK